MPSYGQFCPVSQALELVGERWTLLIIRELLCGNYRFGEIKYGLPLISRSVLSQRLKALEAAGLVERHGRPEGAGFQYRLTAAGRELEPVVTGLGEWGKRWVQRQLRSDELDPILLMWDIRRRLDVERLPAEPTLVMFWFRDLPASRSRYWLSIERPEVEMCLTAPGAEPRLTVETKLRTMVEVWMGLRSADDAFSSGAIELAGEPRLTRAFPSWLLLNVLADVRPLSRAG
ncbi:MAG TPA: helix-turn-helix domain-containing protein [Polyangiaceae bacterium]|jgi:DNA-binding HxlR family transcriptional regulator|nr:helix-turn-helix domain-containing protein [Polyangiaceae bacterium]